MLPLNILPRHIKDELLMREDTESGSGWSNVISEDYTETYFELLKEKSALNKQKAFIASWYGRQGSSKSYSGIATAGVLDPDFSADKIYFDIDLLVNDRAKLKSHDCIILDEMSRVFGTDSMRVSIQMVAMKEQLRKKSIHMIYISPVLKEEYRSSLYVLETLFLDEKNKLSYNAFKTNNLLCLGYIAMPHPLHFVDKKVLIDYEKKKDEHLKEVLEGGIDLVEERATSICKNPLFCKANEVYKKSRGYIPYKILVQIVEKIYPEFKGSVIVYELSDRVKCNMEINSEWVINSSNKKEE
jgi:hypothetical protein